LPFGGLAKAVLEAAGEVVLNALEALGSECKDYTNKQALFDFALGIATDLVGDKLADLIVKYGAIAIEKGLKKLGIGDATNVVVRKLNELFCSFSKDTLVSTDGGLQPISVLEIGDYVLAYDETTSDIGYYPIIGVWVHNDLVLVHLVIDGELIETTPEHPFYTVDNEWMAAGDLQVGDQVRRVDGDYGTVEAVEVVYQAQSMYNFTIATAHTYFVGDGQWLVHNQCFKIAGDLADYTDSEIDAAVYMARRGNDVTLRPPTGIGRTSDLLVNGVPYDVYTPTSANANNIFDNMIKKNNQAEGLFVDLRYTTITPEDLGGSDVVKLLNESGASNIKYVVFYTGE
jgi:hypothetical protein